MDLLYQLRGENPLIKIRSGLSLFFHAEAIECVAKPIEIGAAFFSSPPLFNVRITCRDSVPGEKSNHVFFLRVLCDLRGKKSIPPGIT